MIRFRDLLECMNDYAKITVVGSGAYGLTELYKGKTRPLKEIIAAGDLMEKHKWGSLDKKYCFLTRDVYSIGEELGELIMFIHIEHKKDDRFTLIRDTDLGGEK